MGGLKPISVYQNLEGKGTSRRNHDLDVTELQGGNRDLKDNGHLKEGSALEDKDTSSKKLVPRGQRDFEEGIKTSKSRAH